MYRKVRLDLGPSISKLSKCTHMIIVLVNFHVVM